MDYFPCLCHCIVCGVPSRTRRISLEPRGIAQVSVFRREGLCCDCPVGKIKGEHNDRNHLIPCSPVTQSGINVRACLEQLIVEKEKYGLFDGPAISNEKGRVLSTHCINGCLLDILEELFDTTPGLFPADVTSKDELSKHYQVFRTLRKTSDTQAIEMKVSKIDINVVNRWSSVENAQGKKVSLPMHQHYAQLELLLKPFLRYTWAM